MKKYFWWVGILCLIGVVWGGYGWWNKRTQITIRPEIATAVKKDLQVAFGIDGEIVAEVYQPKFTIAGRVKSVLVKEGDSVKPGQWLVTLDSTEAQKNLEKMLRDYAKERNDFDQDLQVTYVYSVQTDTLKRILEKNQWDLEKAVLDVELKDLALAESRLKAPVSGIVAQIAVKPGDVINTQNQVSLITIARPGELMFEASAEESEILKINEDQMTEVTLDTYPKISFPAKLSFVSPIAERNDSGIVSYPIKAIITDDQEQKIIDGMEGTLNFITKEVKGVVTVPNSAVYREGNQAYVDVINTDQKISRVAVTTGFTNGREVEIQSGITAGMIVGLRK